MADRNNFVVLNGFLGGDPKRLGGENGPVVFRVSVGARVKNKETGEFETKYKSFDTKCWGKLRDIAAGLTDGSHVIVTGSLDVESWEQDGAKKYKTVVQLDSIASVPVVSDEAPSDGEGEWKF